VSGGRANTASNMLATVSGGTQNTSSGLYSTIPGGRYAVASHSGEIAYANGYFLPGDYGNAQSSLYVLRNTTLNNTLTDLYLDPDASPPARLTLAAGRAMIFEIQVVATSDSGITAAYRIWGVIKNMGGNTTMVGASGSIFGEDSLAGPWDAVAEADNVNDALAVRVTGGSSVNIRWVATVRTTEVAW
jgi:hypothetical protein